jgi:hypothetical protein
MYRVLRFLCVDPVQKVVRGEAPIPSLVFFFFLPKLHNRGRGHPLAQILVSARIEGSTIQGLRRLQEERGAGKDGQGRTRTGICGTTSSEEAQSQVDH